jgi:hypothetical protein
MKNRIDEVPEDYEQVNFGLIQDGDILEFSDYDPINQTNDNYFRFASDSIGDYVSAAYKVWRKKKS